MLLCEVSVSNAFWKLRIRAKSARISYQLLHISHRNIDMEGTPPTTQHYWLIDTRSIWNPPTPSTSSSNAIKATAPQALSLIPQDERTKAERYHFHRDAKLSLASSLLKRRFVTTCFPNTSFSELSLHRRGDPKHGKPCYTPPASVDQETENDFNVSHQAGLVALAGYVRPRASSSLPTTAQRWPATSVGVDITNFMERRTQDHRFIAKDGFESWVDMHGEVFSPADLASMKAVGQGDEDLDQRRRKFYTYWCLKEAYVKLEGEALLANWLKEVQFKNVRVPRAGGVEGEWGEKVSDIEIWRNGKKEDETRLEVQAWGPEFLVGTAVKGDARQELQVRWELLDGEQLVRDVLDSR